LGKLVPNGSMPTSAIKVYFCEGILPNSLMCSKELHHKGCVTALSSGNASYTTGNEDFPVSGKPTEKCAYY